MAIARTLGLGLGLIVLVGVGAATFSRAQQAGEQAATSAPKRGELREWVINLRAEVDLLQLEYDYAKPRFMEALAMEGKLKTGNPNQPVYDWEDAKREILKEMKKGMKKGQRLLDVEEVKESITKIRELFGQEPAERLKGYLEQGNEEAFVSLMLELDTPQEVRAELDESRKAIERERQRLLQKARNLYAKQLDLAEAEKRYQSEAR